MSAGPRRYVPWVCAGLAVAGVVAAQEAPAVREQLEVREVPVLVELPASLRGRPLDEIAGDVLRLDRLVARQAGTTLEWWVLDYKLQHHPQDLPAYREAALAWVVELGGRNPWPHLTVVHAVDRSGRAEPMVLLSGVPSQTALLELLGRTP